MNEQQKQIHNLRGRVNEVMTYFHKPSLLSSTFGFQCIQPERLHWGDTRLRRSTPQCFQPGRNLWDSEKKNTQQ